MDKLDLVKEFERSVINQTEAIMRGDPKQGNKFANKYINAFSKLRLFGDEGRDALSVLLKNDRPDVRVTAAAYLLRYKTEESTAVLKEVSRGKGLIAFEAQQALKRWEEGTWALDPAE